VPPRGLVKAGHEFGLLIALNRTKVTSALGSFDEAQVIFATTWLSKASNDFGLMAAFYRTKAKSVLVFFLRHG
jgi:hypothetical protein